LLSIKSVVVKSGLMGQAQLSEENQHMSQSQSKNWMTNGEAGLAPIR